MDFTVAKYEKLLKSLKEAGYTFQTFASFLDKPASRVVVLRNDVDAKKRNSLRFAKIQAGMQIKATFYFRMVPWSFSREVIREISTRGHEIGYHYETMDTANGDIDKAYEEFCQNLKKIREIAAVKTVCMHGSPLSKYDNRSLWEKYDYKELGIIGEPYFDIDFSKVLYLTDTGRRWDGEKVSIRDKVVGKHETRNTKHETRTSTSPRPAPRASRPIYHSTNDIINAAKARELPDQIMLTFHPQRWNERPLPWIKELVWQNVKNQIKRFLVK